MISQPARLTSSPIPGLRQLAARSVAPALLFASLRDSSPRTDEAGTGWVIPSLADCPGLTSILIRCGKRTSVADRAGSTHPRLPVNFVPRANAGFKARHHSRRNTVKSFPSHSGTPSFAAHQRSEGAFSDGQKDFAGEANG